MAGPGVVADLVAVEARSRKPRIDARHSGRASVVVKGQPLAPARAPSEGRVRLHRQLIGADMRKARRQKNVDIGLQPPVGLALHAKDQVRRRARKAVRCARDGCACLRAIMIASQPRQHGIVEALHAQRKPGQPRPLPRRHRLGRHGVGVGFQRDFRALRQAPCRVHSRDQVRKLAFAQQARRAAAEMHRADAARPRPFAPVDRVAHHRLHQRVRFARAPVEVDVEVAIGAEPRAKGPVQVNREQPGVVHCGNWSAMNLAKAAARWLTACLASGSISAKVRVSPTRWKTGS